MSRLTPDLDDARFIPRAVILFTTIGMGVVLGLFGLSFSAALLVVIFTVVRSLPLREVLGENLESPRQIPRDSWSQAG